MKLLPANGAIPDNFMWQSFQLVSSLMSCGLYITHLIHFVNRKIKFFNYLIYLFDYHLKRAVVPPELRLFSLFTLVFIDRPPCRLAVS